MFSKSIVLACGPVRIDCIGWVWFGEMTHFCPYLRGIPSFGYAVKKPKTVYNSVNDVFNRELLFYCAVQGHHN